jgi:hypothetical protein
MPNKWLFLLFFIPVLAFCQERKILSGRVVEPGGSAGIGDVFVINKNSGAETKTDLFGNFSILARESDVLTVYSPKVEVRNFTINTAAFKENPYKISVYYTENYQLKEVVITDTLSSSLGLPRATVVWTPAERKMHASDGSSLEGLINLLSGRKKMLEKAVETEKLQMSQDKINDNYSEEQIAETYKIPVEKVKDFLFYAVEDKELAAALKANNLNLAEFYMTGLAQKYLEKIKDAK